eukprot:scaffold114805_cov56-Attheya_sp.AAC.3
MERSFLVSGQLSRSVYDEGATFTDEIDTYTLEKWMQGTSKLFVKEGSRLSTQNLEVSATQVTFDFDEDLMFRIPFLFPVVSLTGRLILTRDADTGLITNYREFWDQPVGAVLKTARFNPTFGA